MSISMYQASAPVFDRSLGNPAAILTKAAAWAILRHNGLELSKPEFIGSV